MWCNDDLQEYDMVEKASGEGIGVTTEEIAKNVLKMLLCNTYQVMTLNKEKDSTYYDKKGYWPLLKVYKNGENFKDEESR